MGYSHSFSEDFYYANDESESGELQRNRDGKPFTLHSAIRMMTRKAWAEACRANGMDPDTTTADDMVQHARYTVDSCACISVPVEVRLSEDGWHRVDVWEETPRREMTYLDLTRVTSVRVTSPEQTPLNSRRDGYGSRIPCCTMLQLDGKRWHRVYMVCWSNNGTCYVRAKGGNQWLAGGWEHDLRDKFPVAV